MSDKQKIGIAADSWKKKIFRKHLKKKGYEFEEAGGGVMHVFSIMIEEKDLYKLQEDIKEINQKARNSKLN